MKAIIVAMVCMQVTVCDAQTTITLEFNKTPFFEAIQVVQKKLGNNENTRYEKCFDYAKPVTMKVKNVSLDSALAKLCEGQRLEPTFVYGVLGFRPRAVKGLVKDEFGTPQAGVDIRGDFFKYTATKPDGTFEMAMGACDSFFLFTSVNLETDTEFVNGRTWMEVTMRYKRKELEEHKVYYNGYQRLFKERVTGAFSSLEQPQLSRQVFSNAMESWEGMQPGLSFNKNILSWTNQPQLEIRGAATIHAATGPLIVINNFPITDYRELTMLNPQDILSITILKDAAATSIWGVKAGNAVIVITTKTGNYNLPLKVYVSNSVTVAEKPDVWYMPQLSASEYIDIETARYDSGYYNNQFSNPSALISPVVNILQQFKNGTINEAQKKAMLNALQAQDVRNDLGRFVYRNAWTNRHFASMAGGSNQASYYLSAGYDGAQLAMITGNSKRFTSNAAIRLKKKKLEIGLNSYFSYGLAQNDRAAPGGLYPFSRLKDSAGNAATVFADISQHFKDSMATYLQNWDYKPLEELKARMLTQKMLHYRLGFTGTYTILEGLDATLTFQHDQGRLETDDVRSASSYEARHLVNSFASMKNGNVDYIIPKGGFLDWQLSDYRSDRIRTQFNFQSKIGKRFELVALAGFESSALQMDTTSFRYYSYYGDRRRPVLDYSNKHAQSFDTRDEEFIPQNDNTSSGFSGFVSYYSNAALSYLNRYTVSMSARIDRSNLFGARTNKKTVPLGSAGVKWDVSEEKFYPFKKYIPYLSFRSSLGWSGNIDQSTSALISAMPLQTNAGTIYSVISPANPNLRWEKTRMFDLGFTLSDHGRHYTLTFDYFRRKSFDLLGPGEQDPITGASSVWGNFAALKGKGYELSLKTDHQTGEFRIENLLLISRSNNTVTTYYNTVDDAGYFVDSRYLRPKEGYPVYPILAFAWAGLDPATGDPMGKYSGQKSNDYNKIIEAPSETLVNKGSAVPTLYSTLQPQLSWRNWKVSFTMLGKFGYAFRRSSVNYSDPYSVMLMGSNDFPNRWQKPGQVTTVPSMQVFGTAERDLFYNFSEVLVERGDHIRLHDVRLEFDVGNMLAKKWKIHSMNFYLYAANLGLIWSANDLKIDPDYLLGPPVPKSITLGCSFEF